MLSQARPSILRVASVPAAHPYVIELKLPRAGIELLGDPQPPGAPAGRWWPPVMLDAEWISRHAESFDVLHVHFGTESLSTTALSNVLDALEQAGRPLVYTVHDLENPQLAEQRLHLEHLDLLITRAAELITLTRGAAAEIARRWDRASTVISHPRMLRADTGIPWPAGTRPAGSASASALRVGLHLRDLRPSIDGAGAAAGLAGAVRRLRARGIDARASIAVFERVRDPAQAERIKAIVGAAAHVDLVCGPRLSDAALVADLARLDVSVLSYRYGTHSGWAELCWDLGLPIVGTPIGYVAEQHDEPGWFSACDPADPASLAEALSFQRPESGRAAGADGVAPAVCDQRSRSQVIAERGEQRDRLEPRLSDAHRAVYLRALEG
jgi:hypothetical protein